VNYLLHFSKEYSPEFFGYTQKRPAKAGRQLVEKICFFKKVLVLNSYPQTPFPRKGLSVGLPPSPSKDA
jgi:hypothetical protein